MSFSLAEIHHARLQLDFVHKKMNRKNILLLHIAVKKITAFSRYTLDTHDVIHSEMS